jgi:hypothetical protein
LDTKILLDNIMRQTTVLVAQLTVSAGIRAPMAHLADEVFLRLSDELGRQGVPQKVVADMFGVALRSYQRKVARLRQSTTDSTTTLWQGVLNRIESDGPATREDIVRLFARDDPNSVRSVLRDLVQSGLVREMGRGGNATFAPTPAAERTELARSKDEEGLRTLVWLDVGRRPGSRLEEIAARLSVDEGALQRSLETLIESGEVSQADDGSLSATKLFIAPGAEAGWETAVFDHFRAVCVSLAAKLQLGARSNEHDTTGGATFSFDVYPGHPEEARVRGLLRRINDEVGEVWDAVEAYNTENPVSPEKLEPVTFYCGQSTAPKDESPSERPPAKEESK